MGDPRNGRATPSLSETGRRRNDGDIRMTDAGPTGNNNKSARPDYFYGDRNALDDWINQMEIYFMFNNVDDDKKVVFATSFLRGRAQHWIKPYITGYLANTLDDSTKPMFYSFTNFKIPLRAIFGISNEKNIAIRAIQVIRQTASASDYAAKFQEHAQITDWDDEALQVMYKRGLKDNVKDELMRDGRSVDNLQQMIQVSIDIDDKLFERAMEKRQVFQPRGNNRGFQNNNFRNNRRDDRGDPMDLSATQKGRSFKGKGNRNNNRPKGKGGLTCYNCSKEGHMARDCRSPKQGTVQRSQFNAVLPKDKIQFNVIVPQEYYDTRSQLPGGDKGLDSDEDQTMDWEFASNDTDDGTLEQPEPIQEPESKSKERRQFNMMMMPKKARKPAFSLTPTVEQDHARIGWNNCTNEQCTFHKDDKEAARSSQKEAVMVNARHPDHGILHWTACRDIYCVIHRDEKEGANYQPTRNQRVEFEENEPDEDGCPPPRYSVNDNGERIYDLPAPTPTMQAWVAGNTPGQNNTTFVRSPTPYRPTQILGILPTPDDSDKENKDPEDDTTQTESNHDDTPDEDSDDDSDEEIDWSENQAENTQFVAETTNPIQGVIDVLRSGHVHVFPRQPDGTYKVHPNYLDLMLERIRAQYWDHDLVEIDYDFKSFISEKPPIGSIFTSDGYIIPDGTFVNKTMRQGVTDLKTRYRQCQTPQTAAHAAISTNEPLKSQVMHLCYMIRQDTLASRKPMPNGWEQDYIKAIKSYGFLTKKSGNE